MTSTSTSLRLLLVAIMFYSVIQKTQNISIKANSEYFEVHPCLFTFHRIWVRSAGANEEG